MSVIARECDDVYSSRASSAFASASTVDRNVCSRFSKLDAFAIASRAWCAIPVRSFIVRSESRGFAPSLTTETMNPLRSWSSWIGATASRRASSPASAPGVDARSSDEMTNGSVRMASTPDVSNGTRTDSTRARSVLE